MKVLIRDRKMKGGPGIFKARLTKGLASREKINITRNPPCNVELCFITDRGSNIKKKVVRIDGCYYQGDNPTLNKSIRKTIIRASHVVYQSDFSRRMCEYILKVNKSTNRYTVIHNGVDFEFIKSIKPSKMVEPGSFVACANWRVTKRPKSMIKGFLESDYDGKLYIIGNGCPRTYKDHPRIVILGKLSQKETISIMRAARYQIHLCFIESCPNAVIEGLACGLNVLSNNIGGTREIVGTDGEVVRCDRNREWKKGLKVKDEIRPALVADGIERLVAKYHKVKRPDLDMKVCVRKYEKLLRKVSK